MRVQLRARIQRQRPKSQCFHSNIEVYHKSKFLQAIFNKNNSSDLLCVWQIFGYKKLYKAGTILLKN